VALFLDEVILVQNLVVVFVFRTFAMTLIVTLVLYLFAVATVSLLLFSNVCDVKTDGHVS